MASRGALSDAALEDRHSSRRDELAESALATLGELGYARTSLREIAQHSEFTHGVVHYYFANKVELIVYCVRYYKAQCVTRYDPVVETSTTADGLAEAFADKLCETLRDEAPMHRLWYDLRTQSMFDPDLRQAVREIDATLEAMVWRVVTTYADLAGRRPAFDSGTTYALLDGIFENALLKHLDDPDAALATLRARAVGAMPSLLS